jgi:glutamate-1-semialdehyde 2,1-aminomutase
MWNVRSNMGELPVRSWDASAHLLAESRRFLAGGVASSLRSAAQPSPLFFERASGARLWDVDGNEYVDYLLGYGPVILGHCHPAVEEAVIAQLRRGTAFGGQHAGEVELCRRIVSLVPCAERVSLVSTGSEAVQAALRLARAFTRRPKVLRFEGHYHGWIDTIHVAPNLGQPAEDGTAHVPAQPGQSPAARADVVMAPWNDIEAVERVFAAQRGGIAAAICEPVHCNGGVIAPAPGYLEDLQRVCRREGALLILDEVITGFRLALGGAQERFGIVPDLCVLGKALGGGFPLSAVAGRADVFAQVADGSLPHLGTFNGNAVNVAAGIATLEALVAAAPAGYARMEAAAERLATCLLREGAACRLPVTVNRVGPVFHLFFTELPKVSSWRDGLQADGRRMAAFAGALADHGVWVRSNGLWYVSLAHDERDLTETEAAIAAAMRVVADGDAARAESSPQADG